MEMNVALPRGAADKKTNQSSIVEIINRLLILIAGFLVFFPQVNPGRISLKINQNTSLFTTAISYETITASLARPLRMEWVTPGQFHLLMAGAALLLLGIIACAAGACMSLGNNRMKKRASLFPIAGSFAMLGGLGVIYNSYTSVLKTVTEAGKLSNVQPNFPTGIYVFAVLAALILVVSLIQFFLLRTRVSEAKMEMEEKYRLFLMFLPVLFMAFIFCYLPIYGWRFAFFDYKVGDSLRIFDTVVDGVVTEKSNFVGFKWFAYLFENPATRMDLVRVLRNTLIMSGLGIATSWLPIAFAILLAEVRSSKFQRFVQTFTTIPNFISWVLVYSFALAIFASDGFINSFMTNIFGIASDTDYLASADHIWIKMLLWGTWKGVGWSAIIYIAGIAGIDQQLYEAARVDGAGRWQCIWHVTVPGLMPTYCVMLLMSIAGILSNGMEQYLVFENALNKDVIEVLDLYVYNIGIKDGLIPISTVVGISKSLIGITLLFCANRISKAIRGESII